MSPQPLRFDAGAACQLSGRERRRALPARSRCGQFKGGQSNPTYLLKRRRALRAAPQAAGPLLPSAHAVDREFRVITALYRRHFPVPQPVLYCGRSEVVGTPFFVMDYVDGRIFWEPQLPGSSRPSAPRSTTPLNATIADLHSFDPAAIGLGDYGRGENYVARQVERWSKQYRASETETIETWSG